MYHAGCGRSGGIRCRPFDFLPEVVATVDSVPIRRDELAAQLTLSRQAPPNADRAVLARLMRQAVEERIYLDIIRQLLAEQRIVPDEASALAYLKEMNALLPRGIPGVPPAEFARLAAEPQFQLNAALHRYFKQCYPDWVKVDDREVENAYRLDQQRFLLPEKLELGVIEVERSRDNARETIEDARARLRQGENFDRVAAEVSPDGVKSSAETVMELFPHFRSEDSGARRQRGVGVRGPLSAVDGARTDSGAVCAAEGCGPLSAGTTGGGQSGPGAGTAVAPGAGAAGYPIFSGRSVRRQFSAKEVKDGKS